MSEAWLEKLCEAVEKTPLVLLLLDNSDWERLANSRKGISEFTMARAHDEFNSVCKKNLCIILNKNSKDSSIAYFGIVSPSSAVTTLESRIKFKRGVVITPGSINGLAELISESQLRRLLINYASTDRLAASLSPKLSRHLVERLGEIPENRGRMRAIAELLPKDKTVSTNYALQEDAVHSALKAFGIPIETPPSSVDLVPGRDTALSRVNIIEDSAIEHDAKSIPGYELVGSDLTGRAVFSGKEGKLEVYTANRKQLEHCLGIDLIYLNLSKNSILMLQYKMLEFRERKTKEDDWSYYSDSQLGIELDRMELFSQSFLPAAGEYRLNPSMLYLKFVKRDAMSKSSIIMPLEHFRIVAEHQMKKGNNCSVKVSYNSLFGNYMRNESFYEMLRCGYIGGYQSNAKAMRPIIDSIIKDDKAVVAAIHRAQEVKHGISHS